MSDSYFPTDSLNAMNVETTVADAVSGENTSVKLGNLLNGYVVADENNQFRGLTDDSKNLSILTGESLPDYSEANEGDVLQIQSDKPVWGAVDALPEIEETDEGKVLAVDQCEAVWADAPSGLPEITNSDEGKVLTVGQDEQGQPIAGTIIAQGTFTSVETAGEAISGASADDFTAGTLINVSVNGNIYWVTMENEEGTPDPVSVAVFGENNEYQLETDDGAVFFEHPAGTYELIIKTAKYPLSAQWAEPSGGGGGAFTVNIDATSVTTGTMREEFSDLVAAVENDEIIIMKVYAGGNLSGHIIVTDVRVGYSGATPNEVQLNKIQLWQIDGAPDNVLALRVYNVWVSANKAVDLGISTINLTFTT